VIIPNYIQAASNCIAAWFFQQNADLQTVNTTWAWCMRILESFQSMGVPQNGWFKRENPINMDRGTPIYRTPHM
jgi:hypothetical protein